METSRRSVIKGAVGLAAAAAAPLSGALARSRAAMPNIIFIMADDLGYADVGCYGARSFRTPHIDRLAAGGVQLFQGYSNSPVCSATRTALITGRYQYRLRCGLEEPIIKEVNIGLPPEVPTLPSQLRKLGYRTALVGKWHLGPRPDFGPLKSGYDRFFGIPEGSADYFSHTTPRPGRTLGGLVDGDAVVRHEGYLTDLLGDRAVEEVQAAVEDGKPLFLSLHFTAPHWPWEGPDDEATARGVTDLRHWDGGNLETYGKMVESMDANVGKLLAALDRLGIADNSVIVFTSDNGGERFSDTWPFVGAKTELLEGGIRVPLILRWPERIRAGSTSQQVMISMDFLPTLLAAAGGSPDRASPADGENLLGVLTGEAPEHPRTLFWRYKAVEQAAVRDGDWKYLKIGSREYLFNLAEDLRERANLKDRHPERFARLKADFAAWNATMLPYPTDSYSDSIKAKLSDRY